MGHLVMPLLLPDTDTSTMCKEEVKDKKGRKNREEKEISKDKREKVVGNKDRKKTERLVRFRNFELRFKSRKVEQALKSWKSTLKVQLSINVKKKISVRM